MPVTQTRPFPFRFAWLGAALALLVSTLPALADHHDACDGFDRNDIVHRLGTRSGFDRKGAETWQDLARSFEAHRSEIEALLAEKGLSHLSQGLFEAVSTGAVSERQLQSGDRFDWMTWRRKGKPITEGPLCLSTKKTYDAFEIQVSEESGGEVAQPSCAFTATGDCRAHTLSVKVPSSSAGVTVTFGGREIIAAGQSSWDGPFEDRFEATPTFTSKNTVQGKKTVKTHTFIVPKVCLNLSYAGVTTKEVPGETKSCTETVKVESCPEPHCDITAPTDVRKRKPFTAGISGEGTVRIDKVVDDKRGTEFPYSDGMSLKKKGFYTLHGTSETEFGDTASCTARFCVGKKCKDTGAAAAAVAGAGAASAGSSTSRAAGGRCDGEGGWIARFYGARIGGGDEYRTSATLPGNVSERTKLQIGNGTGLGASVERKLSSCFGIEAGILAGSLDSTWALDLNELWDMTDDDLGFLAVTVGPNFHLSPNSPVDFYLGPFIGLAKVDDGDYRVLGQNFETDSYDSEFVWGAQLGLDIPFGESKWGANLGAKYMGDRKSVV